MAETISKTMRALSYTRFGPAAEVLEVREEPVPSPGPGEVLVRIHASGVNPHDTKKRSGWISATPPKQRVVPHSDGAGIVVDAGPDVPRERIGERVFLNKSATVSGSGPFPVLGDGTAAQFTIVRADDALFLPESFSFVEGAAMGVPAFTAYYAVLGDGPVAGRTVLVQGAAGSVGAMAVQLARWNGAEVIGTVSSPEKADIASASGADHVINYRTEKVAERVAEITGGVGVDRIIEVDFGANIRIDAACLKGNGTIASYSSTRVREPVLDYYALAGLGARLNLLQAGNMPSSVRADAGRTIGALLRRDMLHPRIGAIVPFDEAARAHDLVESGETIGNVVLEVS